MSDWITDRRPTADDGSEVWRSNADSDVWMEAPETVNHGEPWQPINRPESYVAPKPKRRDSSLCGDYPFKWIEVMPGDPSDLDALLAAVDAVIDVLSDEYTAVFGDCRKKLENLREARQPELP